MKAVNLIPREERGAGHAVPVGTVTPAHGVLALLAVAVVLVAVYVLTGNTISDRKAQLAEVRNQVAQAQAQAASLHSYVAYQQLAKAREQTVQQVIAARFDWDKSLTELSQVVPSNTSLQSLVGTVIPGAGGGSGGGGTGGLRSAITAPAFELHGCTATQDDVAGLMSRLRVIPRVTRVTLSDSQRGSSTGGASSTGSAGATGGPGCRSGAPSFDVVVFFTPVPNAGVQGPAAPSASAAAATPTGVATTTAATATTTPTAGATTPASGATTPAAGTTTTSATSATTTTGASNGGQK